jgi:hypothetical protein
VKEILRKNRQAVRDAEKARGDAEARVKTFEDADKTALELAQESATTEKSRADAAERRALVLEVAAEKGLTAKQATRLHGSTREELAADADELLADLKPAGNGEPEEPEEPGTGFDVGARGAGAKELYTEAELNALSPAEINANWPKVQASTKALKAKS